MLFATTAQTTGNWNDGRLVTLTTQEGSNSYRCTNIQNAATALFLYNASQNEHNITVNVLTDNLSAPKPIIVPGTTANQGLATIVAINGTTTNSVTLSMGLGNPANSQVQAFLGSVAFPINISGINNNQLPANGSTQSFQKLSRFFQPLANTWYQLLLGSNVNQFMCVQFNGGSDAMTVYCLNPGPNAAANVVQADDKFPVAVKFVTPPAGTPQQKLSQSVFGNNGQQTVWFNADSVQDSQFATISLLQNS